jgi:hypothetical protein
MMLHGCVDRGLVKDTIPDEPADVVIDLGQQSRHLGRVLLMAFRHRGRDNLPPVIHPNMQFLPALALLFTVFLGVPFALTTHLQAAAVNDQGERSLRGALDLPSDRHGRMASRERRVIGAGQRQAHQGQERTEKAFSLAQRQVKEQPERERGLNGNIGIDWLSTPLIGLRSCPSVESVLTEPERDVAATA